jgi:hypothetical protein
MNLERAREVSWYYALGGFAAGVLVATLWIRSRLGPLELLWLDR